MADDHEMRAGCAKEFGRIQEHREEQSRVLRETRDMVATLAGNGNRGRIDDLRDELTDNRLMAARIEVNQQAESERLNKIEAKLLKISGLIITVWGVIQIAVMQLNKHNMDTNYGEILKQIQEQLVNLS